MSKILRALHAASSYSPWVVTPSKHSLETEFLEEPSTRKFFRRSFYQKLIIALCLFMVLIHVKTMMMVRETQEQTFLVLSQLTSQKEQLAQLNTSSLAANGKFHGALQDIYAEMGSFEKGTQTLYQKVSGVENEVSKLNAAVKAADNRYEVLQRQYKEVLEKLQQAAVAAPAQP